MISVEEKRMIAVEEGEGGGRRGEGSRSQWTVPVCLHRAETVASLRAEVYEGNCDGRSLTHLGW